MDKGVFYWHNYTDHLKEMLHNLRQSQLFTDVTLVSDDKKQIKAHKIVLTACSAVFKNIIESLPDNCSIIYLRGIQHQEIESILEFMYLGVTTFSQDRIDEFLNVAQNLGVKEISRNINGDDDDTVNEEKKDVLVSGDDEIIDNIDILKYDSIQKIAHSMDERRNEYFKNSDNTEIDGVSTNEVRTFSGYNNFMEESDGTNESNTEENVNPIIGQKSKLEEKNNANRKFPCNQCDSQYNTIQHLQEHTDVQHDGLRVSCNICSQQFTKKFHLGVHIQLVHQGVRYPCDQCNKQYTTKRKLEEHIMIKHEGLRFHCSQCTYKAIDRRNIVKHFSFVHNTDVKNQPIKLQ